MQIHSTNSDGKWRWNIPADYMSILWAQGSSKIYWLTKRHHIILDGQEPFSGIGALELSIKWDRILVTRDTIEYGCSVSIPSDWKVSGIWVPKRVKDTVAFLLFFWEEWRKTWENMRDTQDALDRLYATQ